MSWNTGPTRDRVQHESDPRLGERETQTAQGATGHAPSRRSQALTIGLLILVTVGALVFYDRPLARGDGLAYLAWTDSLARDGDLNLCNQATMLGELNTYHIFLTDVEGRCGTAFAFGTGVMLWPFYKAAIFLERFGFAHVNDAYFVQHQGVLLVDSFLMMVGTNLYVVLAVVLGYLSARRLVANVPAAAASFIVFLGTPLWYYGSVEPTYAHGVGTFACSLTVFLWVVAETSGGRRRGRLLWLACGLAAGLATLIRWQLAVVVVPIGVALLARRRWADAGLLAAGFGLLAWLVPYSWWWMFGSPFITPAGSQTQASFLVTPRFLIPVLFSGTRGLFVWSPVTLLALVPGLWFWGRSERTMAFTAGAIACLQILLNSMVSDWWAGWAFGMRRMTELYPIFVIGFSMLLDRINRCKAAKSRRSIRIAANLLLCAVVLYSVVLLPAHLNFIWTTSQPEGGTAWQEIWHLVAHSDARTMWQVLNEHTGPWAWHQPGP